MQQSKSGAPPQEYPQKADSCYVPDHGTFSSDACPAFVPGIFYHHLLKTVRLKNLPQVAIIFCVREDTGVCGIKPGLCAGLF